MNTKRIIGTMALAIIGFGLILVGLNGLGLISLSSHSSVSISHAYGETMTNQQLLSAGLLIAPHFNSITPITTTTIPASPFTSSTIN